MRPGSRRHLPGHSRATEAFPARRPARRLRVMGVGKPASGKTSRVRIPPGANGIWLGSTQTTADNVKIGSECPRIAGIRCPLIIGRNVTWGGGSVFRDHLLLVLDEGLGSGQKAGSPLLLPGGGPTLAFPR